MIGRMAGDRIARPTVFSLVMLVLVAALVTVVVFVVEVVVVLARHDFAGVGFAVDWGGTAKEFLLVYAVLLAVLLIGGVGRWRAALALLLPIALLVTMVIAWSDHNVVASRSELSAVGFGFPYDWLIQDHSWMSPPLPYQLSTYDIHQSPTTVAWGAFAVDLLLIYVLLLGALFVARLTVCCRSRQSDG